MCALSVAALMAESATCEKPLNLLKADKSLRESRRLAAPVQQGGERRRKATKWAQGRHGGEGVKAFGVPGSERVKKEAEAEGLDKIFVQAGFEWREPGCSMCLAMNPDKLQGSQLSASSSNRNFKGRQGSSTGRTLLMSPAMVVAAAVKGEVADVRELL